MRRFIKYTLLLFLFTQAFGQDLKLDLSSSGWKYFHLNQRLGEVHALEKIKDKKQRAYLKREIDITLDKKGFKSLDLLEKKCRPLKKISKVKIDKKKGYCSYEVKTSQGKSLQFLFPTSRKSKKVKTSFYWNLVTFPNYKNEKEINKLITSLKSKLDE